MRNFAAKLATVLLLSSLPALATTHLKSKKQSTTPTVRHTSATAVKKPAAKHVEGMATERATEIQTALIKQGYMSGEPSGSWDADSAAAMQKFQADNGWQTKFTPDARALNKLGLSSGASTDSQ